jgi:hypothetical protein
MYIVLEKWLQISVKIIRFQSYMFTCATFPAGAPARGQNADKRATRRF